MLKNVLLRGCASLTFFAYSTALCGPAVGATQAAKLAEANAIKNAPWNRALEVYAHATDAFKRGGVDSMMTKLPKNVFSSSDRKFISEQARGTRVLPTATVTKNGDLLISINENGKQAQALFHVVDIANDEYSVNGKKFFARSSVEENYQEIWKLLEEQNKASSWTPLQLFIDDAHAGGMSILGIVAVVALVGAAAIWLTKTESGQKVKETITKPVSEIGKKVEEKAGEHKDALTK